MSTRRFEITRVPDPIREDSSPQPSEIIPLIRIENEIPTPPPIPTSLASANGKNYSRISSRLFNTILQRKSLDVRRRATISAAFSSGINQIKKSSSIDILPEGENEVDDSDVYSTQQSNNYDTNPLRITNKFLQELRTKRRELREKAKNVSIDQRIASNRRQILRAQDIFAVHFEINDENDYFPMTEVNLFTEESQEKIRNDIYNELNRQRVKQYYKHTRHLLLGRSLLFFMTSLFAFMSLTLIYVVSEIYNRANHAEAKLPESEFVSMVYDKTTNSY